MNYRNWKIWSAYLVLLSAAMAVVLWLTLHTIELDQAREFDRRETESARQEADLQNRISSAVYRMDLTLLPLVSTEAARLPEFYQNSPQNSSLSAHDLTPDLSELVLLHFQIDQNDQLTTPHDLGPQTDTKKLEADAPNFYPVNKLSKRVKRARSLATFKTIADLCLKTEVPRQEELFGLVGLNSFFNHRVNSNASFGAAASDFYCAQIENAKQNDPFQLDDSDDGMGKLSQQRRLGTARGNREFVKRIETANMFTTQQIVDNNQLKLSPKANLIGIMQPIWLDDELLLARQIQIDRVTKVQCCWLNWKKIKTILQAEVSDLLPELELRPAKIEAGQFDAARTLTTILAELVVEDIGSSSQLTAGSTQSGLPLIWVVWSSLLSAAAVSAVVLYKVLELSERRAEFVSAVTHELRTPLTTFRMYSEMLAHDMVPDNERKSYAQTLTAEADRLAYLVDNVLHYARLERGSAGAVQETLEIVQMVDRFSDRLTNRAISAGLKLKLDVSTDTLNQTICTVPANVEQILFNLVDNACKYAKPASKPEIEVTISCYQHLVRVVVQDFGPGIGHQEQRALFQPFRRSNQKQSKSKMDSGVGLGLALCKRMALALHGTITFENNDYGGRFTVEFPQRLS